MSKKLKLDQLKVASFVTETIREETIVGGRLTRKEPTTCTDSMSPGCYSVFC